MAQLNQQLTPSGSVSVPNSGSVAIFSEANDLGRLYIKDADGNVYPAVSGSGGGGSGLIPIQENGSSVGSATTLNFSGSAVDSVNIVGGVATIGLSGGGSGSGSSGSSGSSGADGAAGATGSSGSSGADGATGSSGSSGANGADGATGSSGSSGESGTSGVSGTSGESGSSGSSGADGAAGATGSSGSSGADGATGSSGSSGADGATGATGSSGSSGADGATGATGSSGSSGANGATGDAGSSGSSGSSGSDGATGATGSSGSSGADGAAGATGSSGSSGADGAAGATGSSGSSGANGAIGSSGSSGASGDAGAPGSSGSSGTSAAGGGGTPYNNIVRYEITSGSDKAQLMSAGNIISGLSWSRSGTTISISSTAHGLTSGDYVVVRNMGDTDYVYGAISNVSTNSFDITNAVNSGDTSGTDGVYIPAFKVTSLSETSLTIVSPSSGNCQLISLQVFINSSDTGTITLTLPSNALENGAGKNNSLSTRNVPQAEFYNVSGASSSKINAGGITFSTSANHNVYTLSGGLDLFGSLLYTLHF